jgi:HlyD family secretion protein
MTVTLSLSGPAHSQQVTPVFVSAPPGSEDPEGRSAWVVAAAELQPDDDGPASPRSSPPARSNRRRRAPTALSALALSALALAAVAGASLLWRRQPPLAVQACPARRGSITRVVSAAGKLQAAAQVKLSASVSGELVELAVREGDRVTKGQVLGRIDSRRYGAQVAQHEANRAGAAAEVELESVKVRQLERELARAKGLARQGNVSAAEIDRARSTLGAERARLRSAQERVEQARGALSEVQHNLSLTVLSSPIDGIVTQRAKQVGERVRGSDLSEDVVLVISTLSSMEAMTEVGEREVVFVKEGDPASVEIDAFPDRRFPAQVAEVARHATVKNAGTEGEVTTYQVRLALAAPVAGALPGMSAQATIATDTHEGAVVVPIQAVTVRSGRELGGVGPAPAQQGLEAQAPGAVPLGRPAREPLVKCVFVIERGVARARPVETGLASEVEIEITSGLAGGERVVEGPYRLLSREISDGRAVAVQ